MISIAGIKHQDKLESLPYFTKIEASMLIGKSGRNLDSKLTQLKKIGYLHSLKQNLYVTDTYLTRVLRGEYLEFMANIIRQPSYLSLEYVLAKHNFIPEGISTITSITIKSSRVYSNFLGTFSYQNLKPSLFTGYVEKVVDTQTINEASFAKAVFDYLYLKKLNNPIKELSADLRLNWDIFTPIDLKEFTQYIELSNSPKMSRLLTIIKKICS
ncbi:MAG: hypothetical protein ABII21_03855 [bacterium]